MTSEFARFANDVLTPAVKRTAQFVQSHGWFTATEPLYMFPMSLKEHFGQYPLDAMVVSTERPDEGRVKRFVTAAQKGDVIVTHAEVRSYLPTTGDQSDQFGAIIDFSANVTSATNVDLFLEAIKIQCIVSSGFQRYMWVFSYVPEWKKKKIITWKSELILYGEHNNEETERVLFEQNNREQRVCVEEWPAMLPSPDLFRDYTKERFYELVDTLLHGRLASVSDPQQFQKVLKESI